MKSILIALLIIVFVWGCSNNPDVVTLKSGLKYSEIKIGTGVKVKTGDLIEINFKGWVIKDSSNLFSDWAVDSTRKNDIIADSYAMNQPMKFLLGSEKFIKGSEEGMVGMQAGGQRTIIIPSNLGYGQEGMGPIPPNSSIKVVIELVSSKEVIPAKMWDVDSTLFKTTSSGLKYAIINEGEGPFIEKQKQVVFHYSGYLLDGTKFDSSVELDEPLTFTAGIGQAISGLDEGFLLLKKGSKAKFIIPANLAWGDQDLGKIPPNSTVVFDVKIVDVK